MENELFSFLKSGIYIIQQPYYPGQRRMTCKFTVLFLAVVLVNQGHISWTKSSSFIKRRNLKEMLSSPPSTYTFFLAIFPLFQFLLLFFENPLFFTNNGTIVLSLFVWRGIFIVSFVSLRINFRFTHPADERTIESAIFVFFQNFTRIKKLKFSCFSNIQITSGLFTCLCIYIYI